MATKKGRKSKAMRGSQGLVLAVGIAFAVAVGVGGAAYVVGASYADEASRFHNTLSQTVGGVLKEGAIPTDEPEPSPDGFLATDALLALFGQVRVQAQSAELDAQKRERAERAALKVVVEVL